MARMTLDDLVRMESAVIPGTWAAQVMGMDPTRLVGYGRERPDLIPFPYMMSGNHMKIPRAPSPVKISRPFRWLIWMVTEMMRSLFLQKALRRSLCRF